MGKLSVKYQHQVDMASIKSSTQLGIIHVPKVEKKSIGTIGSIDHSKVSLTRMIAAMSSFSLPSIMLKRSGNY